MTANVAKELKTTVKTFHCMFHVNYTPTLISPLFLDFNKHQISNY